MNAPRSSRFAAFAEDGTLLALVADGVEWPADGELSTLSDDDVGALAAAYRTEAQAMLEDPEAVIDEDRATELATRIAALNDEAGRRYEAAAQAPPEMPAADPPAGGDTGGDGLTARDRLAGLAADPPAPAPAPEPSGSGIDLEALAAATAAATAAALPEIVRPLAEAVSAVAEAVRIPATPRRVTAAELGRGRPRELEPQAPEHTRPVGHLIHTGEAPGFRSGQPFESMTDLVKAFQARHANLGKSVSDDERIQIASFSYADAVPASRDLRRFTDPSGGDPEAAGLAAKEQIKRVMGVKAPGFDPWALMRGEVVERSIGKGGIIVADPEAVVASGGLAAPVEPYYPQLVLTAADRPVAGAMPTFVAERGGIRGVFPPTIGQFSTATAPGSYPDGVTNTDTSLVSATAAFTGADVGSYVVETDTKGVIPAGTRIASVTNATTVVLTAATTGTTTAVAFRISGRNPYNLGPAVGLITAAQDAVGPPSTIKFTYDLPIGTQFEHDVYSVYTSLQFANLTARTFPEQVEAAILVAAGVAARVGDQAMLDYLTGWSTLLTGAKTFGTARQLLAQLGHMAAYYRNHNRLDPQHVLRVMLPAWSIDAMRGDYLSTFIGGGAANWGLSDEEILAFFQDHNILPTLYWDGPSDISQLFVGPGSGAINTNGVNNATPVPIPDYPGTGATTSFRTKIVSFMWAEGTWLGLTTGDLNLGLVRDSILDSQNRFRNFEEFWETPAYVGFETLRCVHTVAADGTYGAAASITLGVGSGL